MHIAVNTRTSFYHSISHGTEDLCSSLPTSTRSLNDATTRHLRASGHVHALLLSEQDSVAQWLEHTIAIQLSWGPGFNPRRGLLFDVLSIQNSRYVCPFILMKLLVQPR